MADITDVKQEIRNHLDTLKTAGTLGSVQGDDFKTALEDREIAASGYPAAILTVPSIESETLTNKDNTRTYTYEITIVMNGEEISNTDEVEALARDIMDEFDDDPTLQGAANGGVEPATSVPAAVTSGDRRWVVFTVTIRARTSKALS